MTPRPLHRLVVLFRRHRFAAWAWVAIGVLVSCGAWLWVLTMPPAPTTTAAPAPRAPHVRTPARSSAPGNGAPSKGAPGKGEPGKGATEGEAPEASTSTLSFGVYAGPGGRAMADAVDQQLHGHVEYALDFLDESSWTTLTQPSWLAANWVGGSFRMVLGVPMLPQSGATLAEGAAGDFDGEFSLLATRLVADGLGTSVLMVGWQPDDTGQPWYVGCAAAARDYVRYWDRIEAAMAAVPGAHFLFEWDAGDSGSSPLSPAAMYPGNAAVDLVATDAFDVVVTPGPVTTRWRYVLDERYGPAWMAEFADAHGKPMAIAMWGELPLSTQGGGGDDPAFVRGLLTWASSAGVQMSVLWDYGSWALTGGGYPTASAVLASEVAAS